MDRRYSTQRLLGYGLLGLALLAAGGVVRAENPAHLEQVRESHNCPGCDLRGAHLGGLNAELGNLKNADLRDAYMYKANLRGADLTGAFLNGAILSAADLRGAKGANLLVAITDERTVCPSGANGPCS